MGKLRHSTAAAGLGAGLLALLLAFDAAGAALPAPLQDPALGLRPVGSASLYWFGLHVYDIALYAQPAPDATNSAAALSIHYRISIKHRRLLDTTLKEWRRLGLGDEAQRAQWLKQLEPLWPDLKPGDRLTAFRRSRGPTQFYFGDRLLGEVADPAFGPAFFAIWLDPRCRYPNVREGLLGTNKNPEKGR